MDKNIMLELCDDDLRSMWRHSKEDIVKFAYACSKFAISTIAEINEKTYNSAIEDLVSPDSFDPIVEHFLELDSVSLWNLWKFFREDIRKFSESCINITINNIVARTHIPIILICPECTSRYAVTDDSPKEFIASSNRDGIISLFYADIKDYEFLCPRCLVEELEQVKSELKEAKDELEEYRH